MQEIPSVVLPDEDVRIICHHEEWDRVYPELLKELEKFSVCGLDTEWVTKDKVRQPIALLQLAVKSGLCILIRLNMLAKPIPESMQELLANPSILKVGVSISEDSKKLLSDHGLVVRGFLDLRNVVDRVGQVYSCQPGGLKFLAKEVLGIDLPKDPKDQCSDWEAINLSQTQVSYAARDVLVGVMIFLQLTMTKIKVQNNRLLLSFSVWNTTTSDQYSEEILQQMAIAISQGIVNCNYNDIQGWREKSPGKKISSTSGKPPKKDIFRAYSLRRSPLYDNCQLLAPDYQMLCTCDTRKAQWYLDKQLAEMVSENPLIIRLKFEPSGRPESSENYYLQEKDNICVVCGKPEDYLRKNVIPHEYRKYFPSLMKDHVSHDILLMCPPCHQKACNYDISLRQQLALECDASMTGGSCTKSSINHKLAKIRSAAKALVTSKHKIPAARKEELESFLKENLQVEELTDESLRNCINMEVRVYNPDYTPHGQIVVEYMKKHNRLLDFQRRWRTHFLETMKPKFLPAKWSVDHNHDRLVKFLQEEDEKTQIS